MRAVLFTLALAFAGATIAQSEPNYPEKVSITYSDGSFFVGDVISRDDTHIHLRLSTLDTIKLSKQSIKKITSMDGWKFHSKGRYHFSKGIYGYVSLGVSVGGVNEVSSMLDFLIGYRHSERLSYGIGFGTAYSDASVAGLFLSHYFVPVFGYGRYYLNDAKIKPYVETRLGYGFANERSWQEDTHSGGMYISPGIGLHIASKGKVKWHIGIGQYIQSTSGENQFSDSRGLPVFASYDLWYNRTFLKIGIEFY